jgi:hypothetical protein
MYSFVHHICNQYVVFGSPRATQPYCRDETDPVALSGVSDFVADHEVAKWSMAALGKTAIIDLLDYGIAYLKRCIPYRGLKGELSPPIHPSKSTWIPLNVDLHPISSCESDIWTFRRRPGLGVQMPPPLPLGKTLVFLVFLYPFILLLNCSNCTCSSHWNSVWADRPWSCGAAWKRLYYGFHNNPSVGSGRMARCCLGGWSSLGGWTELVGILGVGGHIGRGHTNPCVPVTLGKIHHL